MDLPFRYILFLIKIWIISGRTISLNLRCKNTNSDIQKSSVFESFFIELTIFNIFLSKIKK